jgi:hypothetical protein
LSSSKVCNLVEEAMGSLYKDKLQTSETVSAVWMGGPLPDEATCELIEETILDSSIFKSNGITNLELQALPVRTKKGALPKGSKRVKAVHAVCSIEDSGKVRDILKRMYPSKPRKEYPEGVQWRAIENTADPDFPVPPRARMIAERMKYKQANFLRGIRKTTYNHISNLHARLDTFPHQVLARIMYNWRSSKNLDRRLFFLVEQEYEGAPVQFSYSADLEDEVDAILPVLPLILVGRLGSSAQSWFLPSSKRGSRGYRFDKAHDCVVPLHNNDMADLDRNWEQSTEGYVAEDNYDEDLEQDEHGGFAIEFGGFEPNETPDRVSILNDGTDSLATMGLRNSDNDDGSVWSEVQGPQDQFVSTASDGNTIDSTLTSDAATQLSLIHTLLANSNLDQAAKKVLEESASNLRKQALMDANAVDGQAMDEST